MNTPPPSSTGSPVAPLPSLLASALRDAPPSRGTALRSVWIDAPSGVATRLATHPIGEHTVLWAPAGGDECFAGLGAVRVVRASGSERLVEARRRIDEIVQQVERTSDTERPPRLWGGMSFVPRNHQTGCWASFGDALFVLPRWNYVDDGRRARLGLVYDPLQDDPSELVSEANLLWRLAHEPPATQESLPPTAEVERQESTSQATWAELIRAIAAGIDQGLFEKVVAARRSTIRLSPAPDPVGVFERLGTLAPECHRFAFRVGVRTFLGATPERLVSRRGRQVHTHAIAGSIAATEPRAAEQLLGSGKNRTEHRYVVDALRDSLGPLCESLEVQPEPAVRQLRHVLHLQTLIEGTLARDVHLLELVDRLHPTPAVGGVPTREALEWIAKSEPAERGWYASPLGWVDAHGDGDMLVALRSALILEDRVHLYAGAGIVSESEPEAEYAETEVKLRGMRVALGLEASATNEEARPENGDGDSLNCAPL